MIRHTLTTQHRKSLTRFLLAAAITAGLGRAAWADAPAVMTEIPADATGALVIPSVKTLSTKLSNVATRLNLAQRFGIPVPPDIAGFAARNLGITTGLDQTGSAALIVLKLKEGEGLQGPPPMVLLVPTNDAAGLLAPFNPGAADDAGIQTVDLPQNPGEKGYASVVDKKWVALSNDRDSLSAYLKHSGNLDQSISPDAAKVFASNDAILWLNMKSIAPMAQKGLANIQEEITGMTDLANLNADRPPAAAAFQKAALTLYFNALNAIVRDADSTMLAVRITDAGITGNFSAAMKPDTATGRFIAAQKSATTPSLQGLPGGKFLAAYSANVNGPALQKIAGDVMATLTADPDIQKSPAADAIRTMGTQLAERLGTIQGFRAVLLDPAAGGKNGYLNGAYLVQCTDPQKFVDSGIQWEQSPDFAKFLSATSPDIETKMTVTPDAVTIKGVKLAKIHVAYTLREATPDKPLAPGAEMAIQAVQKLYGPDGATAYIGVVGKQVLGVIGSNSQTLEAAVAAAQSNSNTLATSPAVTASKNDLVANPVAVAYLPVGRWIALAESIMRSSTGQPPAPANPTLTAAENAPPVVVSDGVTGQMLQEELHLPIPTLNALIDVAMHYHEFLPGGTGQPEPPTTMP